MSKQFFPGAVPGGGGVVSPATAAQIFADRTTNAYEEGSAAWHSILAAQAKHLVEDESSFVSHSPRKVGELMGGHRNETAMSKLEANSESGFHDLALGHSVAPCEPNLRA